TCNSAENGHWVLEEVSGWNAMPSLQGYPAHVPLGVAEQTLLHAERPVHSVFLNSDAATAEVIPSFLAQLPELRSLTLPSQIAPSLRPEMIGPYVKELKFHGHYDTRYWDNKTVALPSDTVFPGIESLSGSALAYRVESRFRFDPIVFPGLKSIGFTFDPKRRFAQTLRGLPHLRIVNAAAFDDIDSLVDVLPCEKLVSLTLSWNRKIETLAGIERFPNLRCLKLSSLKQLRSLDAIQALQHLEFVGIYWSKRIDQAEALLKLPAIQRVKTFGIDPDQPTWHQVRQEFAARNIDVKLMG
ncbi:MAG: hypothetical protein JWN14_2022, partial [Chthonomonadales bacterium]|nr:hypothetical protein [Chthonomonadales bacterium]